MNEVVIRAEGLGKRYRLGRQRYKTLRDTFAEGATRPFRALARLGRSGAPADDETNVIWALKDATFDVEPGEVVGIVGRNGSGKSTLLKILSRVTEPTTGLAEIRGRVGTLLEVGVGFHPELTGRENIFLSGAVLGMKRAEMLRKFDEIVDFSGNARFLDTTVKHYSSGMYMRLAFAVAAHLELEILLVDEVLAVGDIAFQERCLQKMDQVSTDGRTVLFVSHNLAAVRKLCARAVLLDEGRIRSDGPADDVVQEYLESCGAAGVNSSDLSHSKRSGSGSVQAVRVRAEGPDTAGGYLTTGGEAAFIIGYRAREPRRIPVLNVSISVVDSFGTYLFSSGTASVGRNFTNLPPAGTIVCRIRTLPLIPGTYSIHVSLKDEKSLADYVFNAMRFTVVDRGDSGLVEVPGPRWGSIAVSPTWSLSESIERTIDQTVQ